MTTLKLYLPAIVIAAWAVMFLVFGFSGHAIRAIAWLSVAVAFKVQIDEARKQHGLRRQRGRK